ncbi:MAG: AbrB/MazE/SpoVT family DNA-binding domain-containing protein [Holophaga sp.]|jgi:AbrB family looped-hinge helix DNA binding protein
MFAIPTRVTQGGRLVIPAAIRKIMNLADGDMVMLQVKGNVLQVTTIDEQIDAAQAFCAPLLGEGAVDEFLAERRREAEKELG